MDSCAKGADLDFPSPFDAAVGRLTEVAGMTQRGFPSPLGSP